MSTSVAPQITALSIPDVRSDSSAVGCLVAVCDYFGIEPHGGGAFERLLDRDGNISAEDLAEAASDLGLRATISQPLSQAGLHESIHHGKPVVINSIADMDDEHYNVVVGVTVDGFLVLDPRRGLSEIPKDRFPGWGIVLDDPNAERHASEHTVEPEPSEHRDLAHHYASTWNILHDQGERVPHWELQGAHENLAGSDWHVDLGHDGVWRPMHHQDMQRVYLWPAVEKSYAGLVEKGKRRKVDPQQGLFGQWENNAKQPERKTPRSSAEFEGMHARRGQGESGGGRFHKIQTGNAAGQQQLFGGAYEQQNAAEQEPEHKPAETQPEKKPVQGNLFAGQEIHGQHHAPIGGVTLAGEFFPGGQFIPNADIEKATPAERMNLLSREEQSVNHAENTALSQQTQPTIHNEGQQFQLSGEAPKRARRTRERKLAEERGKHGKENEKLLGAEGGGSDQGGLFAGHKPVGEAAATPATGDQAGTVSGVGEQGGSGQLPDNAGGGRAGHGGEGTSERHETPVGTAGNGEPVERPVEDEAGRGGREANTGTVEPGGEGVVAAPATADTPTDLSAGNFRYTSRDFFAGGPKTKVRNNLEAIKTLKAIQAEGRDHATPEEQEVLSKYVGWGAFAQDLFAYHKSGWESERKELQSLLSSEDYEAARRSTVNAHYTHPDVVDAHWQMAERLGFKGGRYLETSAGIGYYLGLMPPDLAAQTKSTAVEIDPTTGSILKLLYPGSRCLNEGYQDFSAPDGFYDLVASNVPFDINLYDPKTKRRYRSHDFFFLRSLDHVKPGGLVMHITSRYTMDKGKDSKHSILPELADRAEFVGAVRFPGGRHKENAGTEVVTDLIILRKKDPNIPAVTDETPPEAQPKEPNFTGTLTDSLGRLYYFVDGKRVPGPDWTETTLVPDPDGGEPMEVNKYFADHPESILGRLDRTGKMREPFGINVSPTEDYEQRLADFIKRLPEGVMRYENATPERLTSDSLPTPGEVRNGGLFVRDGKVYLKDGEEAIEQKVKPKDVPRVEGQLAIRDAMRALIQAERKGEDTEQLRAELNRVYDAFVKKFGYLNATANYRAFRADVGDSPALLALEHWDNATKTATKADMFSKETIRPDVPIEKASTPEEALAITLNQKGGLDLDHMAALLNMDKAALGQALVAKGLAFHDPEGGWLQKDEYLSGNVRRKLLMAKAAAATDPSYQPNVDALEAVQPADKEVRRIGVKLGAPWIPASDVAQFAAELIGEDAEDFSIRYIPEMGKWLVNYSGRGGRLKNTSNTNQVWGTGRPNTNFIDLLEAAMLNKTVRCYDEESDGTRILNRKETDKASEKIDKIKEKFEKWIWKDDERRERLHRYYNDNINNMRDIQYDGSHLTFPGMNPEWEMRDVQKNFIWQVLRTGKGLTAHEVGIGKTAQLIASGMELKRMGLVKKPMLAVKKANIEEHTAFARWLYPGARILSLADADDAATRKKMVSQIATGDWDLVIMSHTNMDMVEMLPETQAQYLRDELSELRRAKMSAVLSAAKEGGAENVRRDPTVKELEKAEASLEAKLQEAMNGTKKDNAMYFEDLGIDHILVDEAHAYKSLPPYTRMTQIKGVPNTRSARATNMLMRTRWLMDNNGGRGVVFATGTPVGNTMAELYTMQRYLQPKELEERGLQHFDAWAQTFGNVVTKNEFTHSGKYEPVASFSRFTNLPELMALARQFMDVQRVDDLFDDHHFGTEEEAKAHVNSLFTRPDGTPQDVTPEMLADAHITMKPAEGGGVTVTQPAIVRPTRKIDAVLAPKTEQLAAFMEEQKKRAERLRGKKVEKGEDNMLVLCTDNKKASVDMRLIGPQYEDDPASKSNQCVNKVLEIAKARPGVTQLIFSNMRQSKDNPGFNLYDDIINKLVEGGIPREKIADFSQLEGDKRQEVQAAMQRGDILVGIGGTDTLGTGVNVQKKLGALHHLDVPDRPIDIEQRDGRGFRFGNMNDPAKPANQQNLDVYRYLSEGSADDVFWNRIMRKSVSINQVMVSKGKAVPDEMEELDTESMSPERFIAMVKGDPRITEMMDLKEEVRRLKNSKESHEDDQYNYRTRVKKMEEATPRHERRLHGMKEDVKTLESNPDFSLTVGDKTYDDRKEAAEALDKAVAAAKERFGYGHPEDTIGTYRGLPLVLVGKTVFIRGSGDSYATGDTLPSIESVSRRLPARIEDAAKEIESHKRDIEKTRANIGEEWGKDAEYEAKSSRLSQLEKELLNEGKEKEAEEGEKQEEGEAAAAPPAEQPKTRISEQGWAVPAEEPKSRHTPEAPRTEEPNSTHSEPDNFGHKELLSAPKSFSGSRQAADELQDIRNELARPAEAEVDTDDLLRRVDAVGKWAAAQRTNTPGIQRILEEAHHLADKVQGGSGKAGNRIEMQPPSPLPSPPPAPAEQPTPAAPYADDPRAAEIHQLAEQALREHWHPGDMKREAQRRGLGAFSILDTSRWIERQGKEQKEQPPSPPPAPPPAPAEQPATAALANIRQYIDELGSPAMQEYAEEYAKWRRVGVANGRVKPHASNVSATNANQIESHIDDMLEQVQQQPVSEKLSPSPHSMASMRERWTKEGASEKVNPPIKIVRMKTKRGERSLHEFVPNESFWNARKAGKIPPNVTVYKNPHSKKWSASVWGDNDQEIHDTIEAMRKAGVRI